MMLNFSGDRMFLELAKTRQTLRDSPSEFRTPYGTNLGDANEARNSQSAKTLNSNAFKQS